MPKNQSPLRQEQQRLRAVDLLCAPYIAVDCEPPRRVQGLEVIKEPCCEQFVVSFTPGMISEVIPVHHPLLDEQQYFELHSTHFWYSDDKSNIVADKIQGTYSNN